MIDGRFGARELAEKGERRRPFEQSALIDGRGFAEELQESATVCFGMNRCRQFRISPGRWND